MTDAAINELLGGLSATAFLRKYWQKGRCWCGRPWAAFEAS
jgi:hypothetical protein